MKLFYYIFRYSIILLLGHFVRYLGIPSFYELPYLVLIPFNFLAISYGIKHPLEKRKDIQYKKYKKIFIFICVLINTIFILLLKPVLIAWIILISSTIVILLLSTPKYEKINDETQKYIDEYYKTQGK